MFQISRWRERVRTAHPDHLRIARGAARVSAFVLVGKCAGALKEMAIAYKYGINNIVDAYQFTVALVTWLPGTLLAVLGVVLVPVFVNLRHRPLDYQARFSGEMEGAAAVCGIVFAAVLFLCWPLVIRVTGSDLSPVTREMCQQLMYGLAPTSVMMLASGVYAARLQARERHVNTLLEGLPAALILICVLAAPTGDSVLPLIIGTVVGLTLQAVWLRSLATRADGVRSRARLSFESTDWAAMWISVRTLMVGQIVLCFCAPLDQYFMARLGDGSNSTLGYANRVLALLLSMGAMAAARATLPIFSDILKQGDFERAHRTALFWGMAAFAIGIACAVVSWVFGPTFIAVLFQRGAFTAADTVNVAGVFRWGLLQVPFYFACLVLGQLFASEGRFKVMANIAVLTFGLKVIGNFTLIPHFGIAGAQISTALMYATAFFISVGILFSGGHGGDRAARRDAKAGESASNVGDRHS
ncbi:murein biosynthesis integral membrane protein MurJ [Paraburkholderia sp. GAS199]|uniref:murein biosynthesis integral membrane protein MurJ n=1 Tax=Paraburkholderia sp. GAS199 TaxID=3035126 RepID=UPI003D1D3394